jgi:general secretion pathway protein D
MTNATHSSYLHCQAEIGPRLKTFASACACLAVLLAISAAPARAQNAKKFYRMGQQAEVRKQYEIAYADYLRALETQPANLDYQIAAHRARFEASVVHIHLGEELKAQKKYAAAALEFQRALALDSTNVIATQELQLIREATVPKPAPPGTPVTAQQESAIERRLQEAAGPQDLGKVANTPIENLRLTSDSRVAYSTLGQMAGMNVLFDQAYQPVRVQLDLNRISVIEALHILNMQSGSFYTVLTPNTIFVANDTTAKRTELQQEVVKTFYLHNVSAPGDLADLNNSIRALLGLQHFQPVLSQNALIIRDTPDKVALAQKLIDDLDKAPPEVVVDVEVLETSRDLTRDLGIGPPASPLVQVGLNTGAQSSSTNPLTGQPTTGSSTPFTLKNLKHLSGSDFTVAINPVTLNLLLTNNATRTLQAPQLRAMEGQKATLQIGERIPVATGSFGGGFAGGIGLGGINSLVNTQFQYQNVGVNMELKPYVHGADEVALTTKIEISSVIANESIGGVTEPIIGQRVLDLGMIQVKDGESNVLGGILNNQDVKNLSGIPGLSDLPFFKWLSSSHIEHQRDEILIILTPHIVRRQAVNAENLRALDTGTERNVELNDLPPATLATQPANPPAATQPAPGATTPAAPGGTSTPQPPGARPPVPATGPGIGPNPAAAPAQTPRPPGAAMAAQGSLSPVTAARVSSSLQPADVQAVVGNPFGVNLVFQGVTDAYATSLQLNYDSRFVEVESVANGGFLSESGRPVAVVHTDDPTTGTSQVSVSLPPNANGVSGTGPIVSITFRAKAVGTTRISVSRMIVRDPSGKQLTIPAPPPAVVTIR